MFRKLIIVSVFLLTVVIGSGCSDRGDTFVPVSYESSVGPFEFNHEFLVALGFSMFTEIRNSPSMRCMAYVPAGYQNPNQGRPFPTLYMLSPFGETEEFYFNYGLKDVADRLIAEGEIEPMIIITVNGRNTYGGGFYGDKYAGGRYAEIIGSIQGYPLTGSLIDYVDAVFNTFSDSRHGAGVGRANRAISGTGMGGYGAMRLAVVYHDNFSSVSAISAPLDFDGASGSGGLVPFFDQIIDNLPATYAEMRIGDGDPLVAMAFGAAASFSPHDTAYINRQYHPDVPGSTDPLRGWHADDTLRITDVATYFTPKGPNSSLKFHLPFDENGDPYNPIWQLWLDNNIESILAGIPGALDNTAMLLMTSADARYNYDQQTIDFHQHLVNQGIADSLTIFGGYGDYEASNDRFLYDILADILKFHSDQFVVPEY